MRTIIQGLVVLFLCVSSATATATATAETVPVPGGKPCRSFYDQGAVIEIVRSQPGTRAVYRVGVFVLGIHQSGAGMIVGPSAKGCTQMIRISPATVRKILENRSGA